MGDEVLQAEDSIDSSSEEWSDEEIPSSESDESSDGVPPLSPEEIDMIPTIPITQKIIEEYERCTICCEVFVLHEVVSQLLCGHIYHKNCIKPWLELHANCPICRESFAEYIHITDNDDQMSIESIHIEVILDNYEDDDEDDNDVEYNEDV